MSPSQRRGNEAVRAHSIIENVLRINPMNAHHLHTYDHFLDHDIPTILQNNNPITVYKDYMKEVDLYKMTAKIYVGGMQGDRVFYGSPIIVDSEQRPLYPNEARLRGVTYSASIHVDIDVVCEFLETDDSVATSTVSFKQIFLMNVPIMINSSRCYLSRMARHERYAVGECRNDLGGYFVIEGGERVIISQEQFANNKINIVANADGDDLLTASMRSVATDPSKPIRTIRVHMVRPSSKFSNMQFTVDVPNVRKSVPLFILMRALGVVTDRDIIEMSIYDADKYAEYVDVFIPSIHDAGGIYTQNAALRYIASFTKHVSIPSVLHILCDYFLPNVGVMEFYSKAVFVAHIVRRMIYVHFKVDEITDRDSYRMKRIHTPGMMMRMLFVQHYHEHIKRVNKRINTEFLMMRSKYVADVKSFSSLFTINYKDLFLDYHLDKSFIRAFKGNWSGPNNTNRIEGVSQKLERKSYLSLTSLLRKTNLNIGALLKSPLPRMVHTSQWGYIDPLDTPDGGRIGLHKYMAVGAFVTPPIGIDDIFKWMRSMFDIVACEHVSKYDLATKAKLFINDTLVGLINNAISRIVQVVRVYRRCGIIPETLNINVDAAHNECHIHGEEGRISRYLYYVLPDRRVSIDLFDHATLGTMKDREFVTGVHRNKKTTPSRFHTVDEVFGKTYAIEELETMGGVFDCIDSSESEMIYVAMYPSHLDETHSHVEVHPSLTLSPMSNMLIFPDTNTAVRNVFGNGQARQAISMYHTNYRQRVDRAAYNLNTGQHPIVESRYYRELCHNEHPYGNNLIVAMMCYQGYNVEDAIIVNNAAIQRGALSMTYYSMYEAEEIETEKESVKFMNIVENNVADIKPRYNYSNLDSNGIIRVNSPVDEHTVMVGMATMKDQTLSDKSIVAHKGQSGYVDFVYVFSNTENARKVLIRVREYRNLSFGDKMVSRCAQKGTTGMIMNEADMPFTSSGIRPDIIINPHCMPTRKTVGQMIECVLSKMGCHFGYKYNGTAYEFDAQSVMQSMRESFGRSGYSTLGNEVLYNGSTGEQIESDIFIGPKYYIRLKQMTADKINHRARGPRETLTRQPVHGRAKDGGLRIGEMERDAILGHGTIAFLNESMMQRSDQYEIAVCNRTGAIAAFNPAKSTFTSPAADGPLKYATTNTNDLVLCNQGREVKDFSVIRVPYCFKLMLHELMVYNIHARVITDKHMNRITGIQNAKTRDRQPEEEALSTSTVGDMGKRVLGRIIDAIDTVLPKTSVQQEPEGAADGPTDEPVEKAADGAAEKAADGAADGAANGSSNQSDVFILKPMKDEDEDDEDEDEPYLKESTVPGWGVDKNNYYVSLLDTTGAGVNELPAAPPEGWDAFITNVKRVAAENNVSEEVFVAKVVDMMLKGGSDIDSAPQTALNTLKNEK